ncbi:hypothetical protein H920_16291 [Fukomys damarensis]|uniref:Uncharacterized protein n=1 Tax=Fukomys damarensis TaxID=885580 RepID=A0A091CWU4_FUKDA|nr:hypothetical protein H920_16291 [Fukomys damarensis]
MSHKDPSREGGGRKENVTIKIEMLLIRKDPLSKLRARTGNRLEELGGLFRTDIYSDGARLETSLQAVRSEKKSKERRLE